MTVNGHLRGPAGDRGAVLIITALLVPALVAVAALALGTTTLWAGRQDLQRAADLSALAGAASAPAVSTDLPVAGTQRRLPLDTPLDAGAWDQRPCEVAHQQLIDGRSPIATSFRADDAAPACQSNWRFESPLLATLAACAADVAELAGCRDGFDRELRATLPAVTAIEASAASAVAAVHAVLDAATDKLITPALATQLADACISETGVAIFGVVTWVCNGRAGDLLGALDHSTGAITGSVGEALQPLLAAVSAAAARGLLDPTTGGGLGFAANRVPQVGVDVAGLAPALVTPRVEVALDGLTMRPALSPFTFDVTTAATARRVLKSALVLPAIGIPGVDAWSTLPARTQAAMERLLGPDAAALLAGAGSDGWVVDPNLLGESAPALAARVLAEIDALETQLSAAASDALCVALPATIACPVGDDVVDRDHLLGPFTEDVWDATRPPPTGTAPTVQQVLERHAASGEPIYVIGGLRAVRPGEIFGAAAWETLVNPQSGPGVSALVSELMFVPALDAVPAAVVRDGDTFRLERAAAATGLFKARLVG